jgi:hypothetical protein
MPKRIRKKIESAWELTSLELGFLAEHPEAVAWLKTRLEPRLWPQFQKADHSVDH